MLTFGGTVSVNYWPGTALATIPTFTASNETNLVCTVDRLYDYSTGTASRTALWITDATRTYYVLFAEVYKEGGWRYNRKLGRSDDVALGSGVNIAAFDGATFDDGGQHQMKAIANGKTVKLYLDGIFGAEVDFPFSEGIVFQVGSYGRATPDVVNDAYDNFSVEAVEVAYLTTSSLTLSPNQTATNLSVHIPTGLNATTPVQVQLVSSDPTIATPVGAVAGTLTLTFAAGGPTVQTFAVQSIGSGGAQITLTGDGSFPIGNNLINVTVLPPIGVLMQDDFSAATIDTAKWQIDNAAFETGSGTYTVNQTGGTLVVSGALDIAQYWGGARLKTVKSFVATKELNLVCEVDRVSVVESGTAARTGILIANADRSQFVSVSHNTDEGGWMINVNPGNPTGGGTLIPALNASLNTLGNHHIKVIADGEGVDVFVDGISGGRYAFAQQTGIYFELGTFSRALGDTVTAVYDNAKISTVLPPITVNPPDVTGNVGQTGLVVTVNVPRLLVESSPARVVITSRNTAVATVEGATAGVYNLDFAAGDPTNKTFNIDLTGPGITTLDITNVQGVVVANGVNVTATVILPTLLTDDFSGATIDSSKWRSGPTTLESLGTTTNSSVVLANGAVKFTVTSGALSDAANIWWGGLTLDTVDAFTASQAAPVSFEIDRVSHTETGAATRTGFWITDLTGANFVLFAENPNEGGWTYNLPGGNFRVGNNIAPFDAAQFNDHGNHHVKVLANGTAVKFYLDDIFGVEVPFAVTNGIRFGFGAYARTYPDTIVGIFDNVKIVGAMPAIVADPASVLLEAGQTNPVVTVSIPRILNQSNAVQVTITSANPAIAIPAGAIAGTLTLNFAAGAPNSQTFEVVRVAKGTTTLTIANPAGLTASTTVAVTSMSTAETLFTENFDSAVLDTNVWATRIAPFETGVVDGTATVVNGQLEFTATCTSNYWGGISVATTNTYIASVIDPIIYEVDRVSLTDNTGGATGLRTSVWITSGTNFVFFSDLTEGGLGWTYNRYIGQAGDNVNGGGTDIAAFNGGTFDDLGLHHIKLLADGSTVKIYLDGVLGAEVAFPFSSGIQFAVGVYTRAEGDSVTGAFDNIKITGSKPSQPAGKLTATKQGTDVSISWTGAGTLQSADTIPGTWTDVTSPTNPVVVPKASQGTQKFYRLR
jgi:intracellular sulfur oxidation DsrE/DsrF family protein